MTRALTLYLYALGPEPSERTAKHDLALRLSCDCVYHDPHIVIFFHETIKKSDRAPRKW